MKRVDNIKTTPLSGPFSFLRTAVILVVLSGLLLTIWSCGGEPEQVSTPVTTPEQISGIRSTGSEQQVTENEAPASSERSVNTAPTAAPTSSSKHTSEYTPTPEPTGISTAEDGGETGRQNDKQKDISEATYDVSCIVTVLGRSVTDDIVYRGRFPTTEESEQIQHCKLFGKQFQDEDETHDRGQSRDGDGNCDDEGNCKWDDSGDGDDNCDDEGNCKWDDSGDGDENCDDEGNCKWDDSGDGDDWEGSQEQGYCDGKDKDEGGLPTGPQCNIVPTPLPAGVIKATLVSVVLPDPTYEATFSDCQVLEDGQCAELKWEPVADVLAGEFVEIEISPVDPNVMYAGVDSNDMTMYRSLDAGASWELVHVTGHNGALALSPVDRNIALYTNLEWSVQLTVDGGETWKSVLGGTAETGGVLPFTAITFSKDHPNIVYASALRQAENRGGIWPPEPSDLYKSTDSGRTWEKIGACETCSAIETIVVKEGNPDFLWVAADGGVQFSEDGGRTWSGNVIPYLDESALEEQNRNEGNPPKVIGLAIQPGNSDTILAASSHDGMFRSTDGGTTWLQSNLGLTTAKLHHVHFAVSNPDVAYVATHEGVFRSDDAGGSWTERNNGLSYKFVTPIAIDPRDEDVVFVGTATEVYTTHSRHKNRGLHEGEGLYKSVDGGKNWVRSDKGIYEAKIAQMGTHPKLPFNLWVGGESGRGNFFSPDAGNTWLFSPSVTSHYPMVYAFSYDFPYVIYATGWQRTGELTASTDEGASWYTMTQKLEEGLSSETRRLGLRLDGPNDFHIHGLAVAPSDSNIIYVGSVHDAVYPDLTFNLDGAHIWRSSDKGESFPEMSNGFPIETKTSINAIVVHPQDPNIAYAMTTLHETETAIGIYKTVNGAQSWFPVNDGLDVYTNDLQMDMVNPETLYAATESGVYKTINGGNSWEKTSKGIPKGAVIDMAIDPLNPLVLYAITADDIYRTQDGAAHWYPANLGLPLLEPSSKPLSAQEELVGLLRLDRTQTGHSEYGGTFAQDRTLEIDATGRVVFVAVKTARNDRDRNAERLLYRAVIRPLVTVSYEFEIDGLTIKTTSQSNIYDMIFDSNTEELKFVASGPSDTNSRTTVVIPGSLFSGGSSALDCCAQVLIDGQRIPSINRNNEITFEHVNNGRSNVSIKTE